MAAMLDVAKYITECVGEVSAMKLQKLMYYAQAWTMVWDEQVLFDEDFQAWANGPVIPELYLLHRGMFKVTTALFPNANSQNLSANEKENIDKVLSFYGKKTAQWLSELTHSEPPWQEARGKTPPNEPSKAIIERGTIHQYYSGL